MPNTKFIKRTNVNLTSLVGLAAAACLRSQVYYKRISTWRNARARERAERLVRKMYKVKLMYGGIFMLCMCERACIWLQLIQYYMFPRCLNEISWRVVALWSRGSCCWKCDLIIFTLLCHITKLCKTVEIYTIQPGTCFAPQKKNVKIFSTFG